MWPNVISALSTIYVRAALSMLHMSLRGLMYNIKYYLLLEISNIIR